mgnify:CR=1 FL=1
MLEAGKVTKDEVQNVFNSLGYTVDIKTTPKKIANTTNFEYTD